MPKGISEAYKELYHYTTSVGLEGILRTQQLWATHIGYMNDAEEHVGFFIRRMPRLLEKPAKEAVAELLQTERGRRAIESVGGQEKAIEDLRRNLSESARETTVKM